MSAIKNLFEKTMSGLLWIGMFGPVMLPLFILGSQARYERAHGVRVHITVIGLLNELGVEPWHFGWAWLDNVWILYLSVHAALTAFITCIGVLVALFGSAYLYAFIRWLIDPDWRAKRR